MLAVISPAFMTSLFSWSELGAAWVQAKLLIPILYSAVEHRDLDGTVIRGVHALRLGEPNDLDELRDRLTEALGLGARATARWSTDKDHFLKLHGPTITARDRNETDHRGPELPTQHLSDPTLQQLLQDGLERRDGFILYSALDKDVGVPAGTSKRLAVGAAKAEGRFESATDEGIRLRPYSPFRRS
jgi:hypothetical protein